MTGDTDPPQTDGPKTGPPVAMQSRRRRGLRRASVGIVVVLLLCGAGLVYGLGRTLTVPDWVRDRIEARLEQNLNGLEIAFGDVELVVNRGWRPRVSLKNVVVTGPDGQVVAQLADAQASLAMRPLLRGQVQPKSISLSGAYATLRRDASGNLSLSLGANAAPVGQAANLARIVEDWDQLFLSPGLSALVSVETDALTLQYEDALKNRTWTLDDGRVRLVRTDNQLRVSAGFALLSGADFASSVEANYTSQLGTPEADFGIVWSDISAPDIAAQNVALEWLDVLRAPISGAVRGGVNPDGTFRQTSATLQIGAGALQPSEAARPIPFDGARSYVTYHPGDQALVFDEISVSSGWGKGTAEGRAYLGVEDGDLKDLIGQFTLTGVSINPDDLYDQPLAIPRAIADFRMEFAPFRVTLGQMQLTQRETQIRLSGDFSAGAEGWRVALDGMADAVAPPDLLSMWPERAVPKPREWVEENLSGGRLEDINFALRMQQGQKPDVHLDFGYADTTIRFLKTQPPITDAYGQASMVQGRFVTTATSGLVTPEEGGPVDVSGTSFIIPDVDVKPATPAVVRVSANGSVTAFMSLLNRPPLSVLKDTPLPVDLAQGQARITGTLSLPMKPKVPFEDLVFHLTGDVDAVESSVLVPGYTVVAPQLGLRGDQTEIIVEGSGTIGPVPVDVQWRQPLGKEVGKGSRVEGTVELSQRLIDTFGIGLPDGSVSGVGSGTFSVGLAPDQPPSLTVSSDLEGVGLSLPPLGWSKPAARSGRLEISGVLGAKARIDKLVLEAAGLSATGTVLNREGGGLDRALLSSVRLYDWLDASVELVGRGNLAPDIRILAGTLDMRKATFESSGSSSGQSGGLQVALNRLQVTDTIALTNFAGAFQQSGGLNGRFSGRVNGQTPVTGELIPQSGRSAVRVRSDDAGGVVRSAGLLKQARGGSFDMTLLPARRPGQFDGTLRIRNTQVLEAPAIAALLNSISIVGLFDELSGQGIQFSDVSARFLLGPAKVTVYESSATGPSIGLSMDGVFDVPTGILRMQGVISPVYLLNQIGNLFSRRGEGVFGFNYTLTGPADAPSVQVNPLSALTPGALRDIMRASPPPVDENAPPPRRTPHRAPDDASSGR